MIFKEGDIIEYPNNLTCMVKCVDEYGFVHMFSFEGTIEVIKRSVLLNGIAKGNIKFKNYGKDLQPIKYIGKEHKL
jgi:hypothetical protein